MYNDEIIMDSSSPPTSYLSCIVDTGTTLMYIPREAYNNYVTLTGGRYNKDVGLLSLSESEAEELGTLTVKIGEVQLLSISLYFRF